MENSTRLITRSALAAAAICVLTMVHIKVPLANSGYIHLGDTLILLAGCWLPPIGAAAASGIGSMLSDLLLGYATYAVPTLIIKGCMGALAAVLARYAGKVGGALWLTLPAIVMMTGYFVFEGFLYSWPTALAALPFNLVQAVCGSAIALILRPIMRKTLPGAL